MNTSAFIANRIAFNQKRSFSRFITRLSVIATVISVVVMIITLAFANGFQAKVAEKVFSFWGHVRLQDIQSYQSVMAEELPVTESPSIVQTIRDNPEVASIHPFANRYAILKTVDDIEGVLVKGYDNKAAFDHVKTFIVQGKAPAFNDSSYSREIMISRYTADQMRVKTGDKLLIYFIRPDASLRPDKLTISGIYKTGIQEYDRSFALGDIKLIRRLNDWAPDQVGGYEIFLKDYKKIDLVTNQIMEQKNLPGEWVAESVKNIAPNIFDWLNMQDVTRNVLLVIMVIVAVINLITCLIILVLERMRMIGILKAVGATDGVIQRIFLRQSLLITLSGIVTGTCIALAILFLQEKTGFIQLDEDSYFIKQAAVKISTWEILAIDAGTFLVCLLVLMIPTIIVKKVQPVKAIQFR